MLIADSLAAALAHTEIRIRRRVELPAFMATHSAVVRAYYSAPLPQIPAMERLRRFAFHPIRVELLKE
jgi:hypothetical protein